MRNLLTRAAPPGSEAAPPLSEVFGPTSSVPLSFVDRGDALEDLVELIRGRRYVVVSGEKGVGKTTLLRKAFAALPHVAIDCKYGLRRRDVYRMILRAGAVAVTEVKKTRNVRGTTAVVTNAKTTDEAEDETVSREVEINLSDIIDVLLMFRRHCQAEFIILNDFQKLGRATQGKILADLVVAFENAPVRFMLVGTWVEPEAAAWAHPDLAYRTGHVIVPDWTPEDLRRVIDVGARALGRGIPAGLAAEIVTLSRGEVRTLQALCHEVFAVADPPAAVADLSGAGKFLRGLAIAAGARHRKFVGAFVDHVKQAGIEAHEKMNKLRLPKIKLRMKKKAIRSLSAYMDMVTFSPCWRLAAQACLRGMASVEPAAWRAGIDPATVVQAAKGQGEFDQAVGALAEGKRRAVFGNQDPDSEIIRSMLEMVLLRTLADIRTVQAAAWIDPFIIDTSIGGSLLFCTDVKFFEGCMFSHMAGVGELLMSHDSSHPYRDESDAAVRVTGPHPWYSPNLLADTLDFGYGRTWYFVERRSGFDGWHIDLYIPHYKLKEPVQEEGQKARTTRRMSGNQDDEGQPLERLIKELLDRLRDKAPADTTVHVHYKGEQREYRLLARNGRRWRGNRPCGEGWAGIPVSTTSTDARGPHK